MARKGIYHVICERDYEGLLKMLDVVTLAFDAA
jgi:hypothetical protein